MSCLAGVPALSGGGMMRTGVLTAKKTLCLFFPQSGIQIIRRRCLRLSQPVPGHARHLFHQPTQTQVRVCFAAPCFASSLASSLPAPCLHLITSIFLLLNLGDTISDGCKEYLMQIAQIFHGSCDGWASGTERGRESQDGDSANNTKLPISTHQTWRCR